MQGWLHTKSKPLKKMLLVQYIHKTLIQHTDSLTQSNSGLNRKNDWWLNVQVHINKRINTLGWLYLAVELDKLFVVEVVHSLHHTWQQQLQQQVKITLVTTWKRQHAIDRHAQKRQQNSSCMQVYICMHLLTHKPVCMYPLYAGTSKQAQTCIPHTPLCLSFSL